MRHLSILILISLVAFGTAAAPGHSCAKPDCCKTADAACCKAAKACCNDADCCTTAADGTHQCAMKHADGTACASSTCCKEKSCETKKSS
ncbi:MAG: hypothetical protein QOD39_391 [Mycobacterium sp.]|nr:hypothetical protein [Mycobacterium sp.]